MVLYSGSLPVILVLFSTFLIIPVSAEVPQCYCGRGTYGAPKIEDCFSLLESFANHQDYSQRVFDEEQMRANGLGSWPGVIGTVGRLHLDRVVQVPRFYTSKSCNFGLVSYASGYGAVSALGGTSWSKVNDEGNFMMTKCLLNGAVPEGGVVVIPSTQQPTKGVLSLFMWETGSIFDQVLNEFNNSPAGVIPAPGNALAANTTSANAKVAAPTVMMTFSQHRIKN